MQKTSGQYVVGHWLTLQPEVMYSGQGTSSTSAEPTTTNYDYLNMPILFKYLNESGFFIESGPQIGFLLNANVNANGIINDFKNNTQSMDFSWVFGVGYKIPGINLGIDARYNLGITNTINENFDLYNEKMKNSVFQIDLFYQFKNL